MAGKNDQNHAGLFLRHKQHISQNEISFATEIGQFASKESEYEENAGVSHPGEPFFFVQKCDIL